MKLSVFGKHAFKDTDLAALCTDLFQYNMPDFFEAQIKFCAGHAKSLSAIRKALIGFAYSTQGKSLEI